MKVCLPAVAYLLASFGCSTAFQTISRHSRHSSIQQRVSIVQKRQIFTEESILFEPSSSALFTNIRNDPNEKKKRPTNPIVLVRQVCASVALQLIQFPGKFKLMTRKAKVIFAAKLLCISLVFFPLVGYALKSQHNESRPRPPVEISYSHFQDLIETQQKDGGQIVNLRIGPDKLTYQFMQPSTDQQKAALKDYAQGKKVNVDIPGRNAFTRRIPASPEFLEYLRKNKVAFTAATAPTSTRVMGTAVRTVLACCYAFFLLRVYRNMTGSGGSGNSPGKLADMSQLPSATFDEIQGIDNAKFEVMELVDTLRNPSKYAILGARAPTGLLLEGPPGTGKTLLARATAATAGVPLIYCSGSDFVEMYVGRGAARVRKTFEKAQRMAPCIIFIDELDALGKARDTGMMANMRGNDEAEQTLNQLLACMDGLDSSKQICVLAATNRREVLDQALIRPGRFDRMVKLTLPNTDGREAILRVHAKKLPGFQECSGVDPKRAGSLGIGSKVDLSAVASATPGLSGAELEFIVNEAAIRAVRRVTAALREGKDPASIIPNVDAEDFESSVVSFFESRRKGGMSNVMKNVFG